MSAKRIAVVAVASVWLATGRPSVSRAGEAERAALDELRAELDRVRADSERRLAELEAAIARLEEEAEAPPAPAPPPPPSSSRGPNALNPSISVIGDFLAVHSDAAGRERDVDLSFSEIELGFQGAIDPFVRFDLFAAFHEHSDEPPIGLPSSDDDHDHEDEDGHEEEGGLEVELEEAYLTTLGLPAGLQLKAGRFRQAMGRQNLVHLPEDPWADQPTVNEAFFGADQLIDDGLQLSWLLPTPFYWELSGTITRGPSESPTFTRSEGDDFLHVLHSKWFADASDTVSVQVGASWATGPADEEGRWSSEVAGLDFTLAWTPSSHRGLTWQTELFRRDRPLLLEEHAEEGEDDHELELHLLEDWGAYTWLEARLSKRWFLGLRVDHLDYDDELFDEGVDDRWDASLVAAFRPSEYQALRFQVKRTWDDLLAEDETTLFLNWTWSLGAHGAHPF